MSFANFVRGLVRRHPELKLKLKRANSKLSPFQYMLQTLSMTAFSFIFFAVIIFMFFKQNFLYLVFGWSGLFFMIPFFYGFWLTVVDVQTNKLGRELDGDLLFVSEYLLVSLESGLPIGNAIENLSKIKRPGGVFFKRVYDEFRTGKSFEEALKVGAEFSASRNLKKLVKKLRDSMEIGVDLRIVLVNFIEDASERKLLEVKAFAKKLNPLVMMYLLMGIVLPSLGITFFILGAAIMDMTPGLLKLILMFVFLIMFAFQYFAYSTFKFSKATI